MVKLFSKAFTLLALARSALAFQVNVNNNQYRVQGNDVLVRYMGFDLSGNTWKPDSASMGSTDTGDYFPDDFDLQDHQSKFSDGMMGSQAFLSRGRDGPALPGLENLGADAVVRGGIAQASDIPTGMQFIPSSVPDGVEEFQVASQSSGTSIQLTVRPVCMTFEDYYAAFAPGSHPSLTVGPVTGRMDRRGGEPTILTVACTPNGQAGQFVGDLVINLPEDNSKICYKIIANSY
jgi:hypothetical protein